MKSNVLAATHHDIIMGSEVLFYKEPPLIKWTGPFCVLEMKRNAVFVENEGRVTQMSVERVEAYRRPSTSELLNLEGLPVSSGNDNSRGRNLSLTEASDAWLHSLRDQLPDVYSTPPNENAISLDGNFQDSVVYTTELICTI